MEKDQKTIAHSIDQLSQMLSDSIKKANSIELLESVRAAFFGRNGSFSILTADFKELSAEDRKKVGPLLQAAKQNGLEQLEAKKLSLEQELVAAKLADDAYFDVTAYQPDSLRGSLHPITQITRTIEAIFSSMGYEIVRGPEVETEYYNFEALNIPKNHPARDMWDTLWLNQPGSLLRTHTSAVQVRMMEQRQPPYAIASAGRVYRHEATDATHDFVFHQVEALVIAEGIALTHLLGTVKTFLQALFNTNIHIRVRPSYFPFVEPGVEVDFSCPFCKEGCSICKQSKWIEMGGAGLVHPNVLECSGIDSQQYSGFAFGMGLSRLAMLYYQIPDVRLFGSGKIDFLAQF